MKTPSQINGKRPGAANHLRQHRFQPGNSGGPGRPKKTVEQRALEAKAKDAVRLRRQLAREAPRVVEAVIREAKTGDTAAQRLVLERVYPAPKDEGPRIAVPGINGDPAQAASSILGLVERGEISAERADLLLQLVERRSAIDLNNDVLVRLGRIKELLASGQTFGRRFNPVGPERGAVGAQRMLPTSPMPDT